MLMIGNGILSACENIIIDFVAEVSFVFVCLHSMLLLPMQVVSVSVRINSTV